MVRQTATLWTFNLKTEDETEEDDTIKMFKNVDRNFIKGPDEMKAN